MQPYITYLHDLALKAAEKYFKAEAKLIEILQKIDQKKVFRTLGYPSLFSYATKSLKLPENTAYTFITVARKAVQIPELKAELKTGALNLSNAKRIAPILNQANKKEWIEKAKRLSQKKLEQEIAKEFPREATQERFTYVTETRLNLALGISETLMKKLKRAQDLVSQSKQKPASFEETLEEVIDLFLKKKDPVEIARQLQAKKQRLDSNQKAKLNPKVDLPTEGQQPNSKEEVRVEPIDVKLANSKNTKKESKTELIVVQGSQSTLQIDTIDKLNTGALQKLDLRRENLANAQEADVRGQENFSHTQQRRDSREPVRKPLPASAKHAVALRDRGRCTYIDKTGQRCEGQRWLHAHHVVPVSAGGTNDTSNLMTLCSHHHAVVHQSGITPVLRHQPIL